MSKTDLAKRAITELAHHVPILGGITVVPDVVEHLLFLRIVAAAYVQHLDFKDRN